MNFLLLILFLFGCSLRKNIEVIPASDADDAWICLTQDAKFVFKGGDAQEKAHERCDSFQLPYNKLKRGKE